MTNSATRQKKKKEEQKYLADQELRARKTEKFRLKKERDRQALVSIPSPIPPSAPSIPKPPAAVSAPSIPKPPAPSILPSPSPVPIPHDSLPNDEPCFPPGHPASNMPADMRSFIYDPRAWEDDEPPPVPVADPKPVRRDLPVAEASTIHSIPAAHSPLRPRDFSALRSESAHPWHTIRRRNQRLLPQRRPFPHSLPKRMLTPEEPPPPPPATLIPIHGILTEDPNDRVPVLVLPRPVRLPWDPYHFIPSQYPLPARSLPGETVYGPVQSGLALVCAREYPWIFVAHANISEIAWGAHPPDVLDEREDVLHELPPDQLVFLAVLVEICNLEPVFASFLEPAIADFVNGWLEHCISFG
ncbi:hypothetical protein B0H11DRAFT_2143225 [Mycena galericulata]|nr:hypothetical protein B0H11DRAFT_2143225 [Mycena galericulata]